MAFDSAQLGQLFQQNPGLQKTMQQAQQIADMIKTQRSQQRTQPALNALSQLSGRYGSAQTDEQRRQFNSLASQARANYLQGGGSPADLPQQYWGADPMQGFQTSEGFKAPITGYEGLGRKDAISSSRQALMDALTQRVQEAGLTGIDPLTNQKTWDRQYQEASMANRGSGGGSMSATDIKNMNTAAYLDAVKSKIDAAWAKKDTTFGPVIAGRGGGWAAAVDLIPQLIADVQADAPALTMSGVKPDDVIDYLYQTIGGFVKKGGQWVREDEANKDAGGDAKAEIRAAMAPAKK